MADPEQTFVRRASAPVLRRPAKGHDRTIVSERPSLQRASSGDILRNLHGSCPKCFHWHNSVPQFISNDPSKHVDIRCHICNHKMFGLGGHSTHSSLMSRLSEDIAASLRAGVCSDSVVVPRPCRSPSELSNASQVQTPQRRQSLRPSEPSLAPPQISGASTSARKIPSVRLSSNNSISRGDKEPGQVEEVHFTKPKYPHTGRRRQKLLRRFGKLLGIDVDVTPRAHHATEIGKSDRPGTSESSTKGNVTSVSVAKLDNGNLQTGAKDLQTQPSPIEEQSEEEALSRSPTRTNSMDEEVEKHSEVDKSTKEVHNSTTSANAAKARFCRRRRKTNDALEALICRCSETCLCRKYVGCLDNSIASDRATASSRKLSEDVPSLVSSRSESDVSTNALIRMRRHLLEGVGGVLSPQGRGLRDSPESSQSDRSGHARRAAGPLTYTQSSNDSRRTGVHESSHSDSIESVMRSATVGARNTE